MGGGAPCWLRSCPPPSLRMRVVWGVSFVLVAVLLGLGAGVVEAQSAGVSAYSGAFLHRTVIEEGQTRQFEISNLPDRPRYFVFFKSLVGYTAEASDVTFRVHDRRAGLVEVAPGVGSRASVNSLRQRVRFEVEAHEDSPADSDDETFGVRLCTTASCAGGTVLGDWTVTITDVSDSTLAGMGASITVSGGSTSMMERLTNNDNRDARDTVTVNIPYASRPSQSIVVLGLVDTTSEAKYGTVAPIANIVGTFAKHAVVGPTTPRQAFVIDLDRLDDLGNDNGTVEQAEWVSEYEVPITAFNNAVDTPGGVLSGNLRFTIYQYDEHYYDTIDTTINLGDGPQLVKAPDTSTAPTLYMGIVLPDVPLTVTDDDEVTEIVLDHAATPDQVATEGSSTDTAKFRVTLGRGLAAGESLTVPLAFQGATLGTHFTLSLDGSPQGVVYADSADGETGELRFTGPSAAEVTVVVTAAVDDGDTASNGLVVRTYPTSEPWKGNHITTNLAGGVCSGDGCGPGRLAERLYRITLGEAQAGLAVIDNKGGRLLEGDIVENVPVIVRADPDGQVHYEIEKDVVTEGGDYSYEVRLSAAPASNVTVTPTSSDTTKASVSGALTFTSSNWSTPQTVTVTAVDNSADSADIGLTITHAVTGSGSYASIPSVSHPLTLVDDDPTAVSMVGAGVRTSASGTEISEVMVEGDPTRVDRSLTISLGRPLAAGEWVRVPLYLEATGHRTNPDEECNLKLQEWWDEIEDDPDRNRPAYVVCDVVSSVRGPRYSANVAWPVHHNDFVMAVVGTGVSVEAVNRYTPAHAGFRWLEFDGAGAQTATIELKARGGFDDGDVHDEAFSIQFPRGLQSVRNYTDDNKVFSPQRHLNPETNLGGGVTAAQANAQAWYGIADDEEGGVGSVPEVPVDWPLLPAGLNPGDLFRLIYVTSQATTAQTSDPAVYDTFVRAEITGNNLVNGGVSALAGHAESFKAIAETSVQGGSGFGASQSMHTTARDHAQFNPDDGDHPDVPIYWVAGAKVADDNADFTDGDWDDEANPRRADGTAATVNASGYWTGSGRDGVGIAICDEISNGRASTRYPRLGWGDATAGLLNNSGVDGFPLGPRTNIQSSCGRQHGYSHSTSESRPMYALSGEFAVAAEGATIESATATEGSAATFTVTIPEAAPAGGITVPYTFDHGLGIATDPAHIVADASDFADTAGSVTIAEGATTATISVATTQDSIYEGAHYFRVTLGTPTGTNAPGAHPTKGTATGTITDAADLPALDFSAATASAAEDAGTVDVTVTKTGTTAVPLSMYWTTADDTASHPGDYTAQSGYLEFATGDTSRTLTIDLVDDNTAESAETFKVQLDGTLAVDARVGSTAETTITVNDDDGTANNAPTVANLIPDGAATVGVLFSYAFPENTFSDADSDGLTYGAAESDGTALPSWLAFDALTRTFSGTPQSADVGTLSVRVTAEDGNGGTVSDTFDIVVTVLVSWSQTDDSSLPGGSSVVEGDTYTVKVSLSGAASGNVTIPLGVANISARAADYTIPTSVTVLSGQSSATFDVEALIDELREDNEGVRLTLCPTASCPSGYTSGATPPTVIFIVRDPAVLVDVSAIANNQSASHKVLGEGGSGTFTVALERDPVVDATVTVKAVDGNPNFGQLLTATPSEHIGVDTDADMAGFQDELTFTGGNSGNWNAPRTVRIHALYDADTNTGSPSEYSVGFLNSAASGLYKAQVQTNLETIDLLVSDAGNAVVVPSGAVSVTASGTVEYDVQLASDPGGTVVVTPTSSDTTKATVSGALTFTTSDWNTPQQVTVTGAAAGSTTITHAVTTATTAYPTSLTIDPVDITVAAAATEPVLTFGSATYSVTEGDHPDIVTVTVTVNADSAPTSDLTVSLSSGGGTATVRDDYTAPPATFTFTSGNSSETIDVSIVTNDFLEGSETFTLTLQDGTGYTVGTPATTTVTITDDDNVGVRLNPASYTVAEGDGTVTVGVQVFGIADIPIRVTLTPSDGTATGGSDPTAAGVDFDSDAITPIAIPARDSSVSRTIAINDDNIFEQSETFTVTLSVVAGQRGVATGFPVVGTVTITDNDPAPVTVVMSASDGDSDGNAVEGAAGSTGYRTITITLGRALTGSESVTVPLSVVGATAATDYTFGLQPTSQTGVSFTTSGGTHTAQNPAVEFTSGASSATLRLTPVDNNARTQPYVVVDYGTGSRVPSASGVTLGDVSGGPIGIVLVDDESGDIEVPADWALTPSALSVGDDFRLLFRTSEARDASSSDIGVYDKFVRGVLAGGGHADVKAYAGFFKVFASTRSSSGSSGTTARVHNDMTSEHTGHNPTWGDGSGTNSDAAGTPTYWLNGAILANNYRDLCDQAWSGSGTGVRNGFDTDDPRSEDGTRNVPSGTINDYQPYEPWTGSGNACEAWNFPLGNSTVSRGGADSGGNLWHAASSANTEQRPMYGYSPVFTVAAAATGPVVSVRLMTGEGENRNADGEVEKPESDGSVSFPLSLDTQPAANLTVCVRVVESGDTDRVTSTDEGIKTVSFMSGVQSGSIDVDWTDNSADDLDSVITVTAVPPSTAGCSSTDSYSVSTSFGSDKVRITDDEATTMSLGSSDMEMTEQDASDTATLTVSLGRPLVAGESVVARITLATGTGARLPGHGTPDFAVTASGTGVVLSNATTATPLVTFTGSDSNTVQTATVTLTPVAAADDGDTSDEEVTATLSVVTGTGSGTVVTGGGVEVVSASSEVDLTIDDDEAAGCTAQSTVLSVSDLRITENGGVKTYCVRLTTAPSGGTTTVTIGEAAGTAVFRPQTYEVIESVSSGAATVSPSSLMFTASNYTEPQEVTVTAIDEAGTNRNRRFNLTHTANGGGYSNQSLGDAVPVLVTDAPELEVFEYRRTYDEAAYNAHKRAHGGWGIFRPNTLTSTPGLGPAPDITPGEVLDYYVRLSAQPAGEVTVTIDVEKIADYVPTTFTGISFTRGGTPQQTLTFTFHDGDPTNAGCADGRKGGDRYTETRISWKCYRAIWVHNTRNSLNEKGTRCANVVHDGKGGGFRAATVDTIRAFSVGRVFGNSPKEYLIGQYKDLDSGAFYRLIYFSRKNQGVPYTWHMRPWSGGPLVTADTLNLEMEYVSTGQFDWPADCPLLRSKYAAQHTPQNSPQNDPGPLPVQAPPAPPAPTAAVANLTLTAAGTSVEVAWDAVPDATKYLVAYSAEAADGQAQSAGVFDGVTATSYTFDHGITAPATVTVTVTPGHDTAGGTTAVYLDDLAATATVNTQPAAQAATPEVTVTAGGDVAEGADATFTVTATPAPQAALTVTVEITQTGDHAATTGTQTVTIPTGGAYTLTVATTDDSTDEADGTVTATVNDGAGYTVATADTASVAVVDNDPPPDCVSDRTLGRARDYYDLNRNRAPGYGKNWRRVLIAFGDVTDNQLEPFTAAEARQSETRWTGWRPFREALECIEKAQQDPAPPPDPEISITAGSDVTEGTDATFTLTAGPAPAADLNVTVEITQTGDHATTTGTQTVTIPTTGTYTLVVATTDDTNDEADGSVTATVDTGTGYTVSSSSGDATVNVADDDTPEITITAGSDVTEGSDATFTLTAGPAPAADLNVTVEITQTGDHATTTGTRTVTIPTTGSYTLVVATTDDTNDEADGSVTATVDTGTGYTVSSSSGDATVNVSDDDTPEITITAGSAVTEGSDATFTLTAAPTPHAALDVTITVTQTGDHATTTGSRTVTIPTGGSYTLTVATTDDSTDEPDGTITATVDTGTGYTVSSSSGAATVAVADDDTETETCAPELPADAVTVEEVTGWRDGLTNAAGIKRFNRVLAALAEDTGETPMTAEQAQEVADWLNNTRWDRVARTLTAMEQAQCEDPDPDQTDNNNDDDDNDDDPAPSGPPVVTINDATATEGDPQGLRFVVEVTPASDQTITLGYGVFDRPAIQGEDFTAPYQQFTLNPGEGRLEIVLPIIDDNTTEPDETLNLFIYATSGITIPNYFLYATGTIQDND